MALRLEIAKSVKGADVYWRGTCRQLSSSPVYVKSYLDRLAGRTDRLRRNSEFSGLPQSLAGQISSGFHHWTKGCVGLPKRLNLNFYDEAMIFRRNSKAFNPSVLAILQHGHRCFHVQSGVWRDCSPTMTTQEGEFKALLPELMDEALSPERDDPEVAKRVSDAIEHLAKVLSYNVPGGKLNRGLAVVTSVHYLSANQSPSGEQQRKAMVLGWCVEILQAFLLVADDIMDQSPTRRGKTSWYKKEGIGLIAINDAMLLQSVLYRLLKKYFQHDDCYKQLLELFLEVTYQTELGQCLDLLAAPLDRVQLDKFTLEKYQSIVLYKTAFYSFYLPVAAAMNLTGFSSPDCHAAAKTILLPMGEFFQIQDDYLDCFGDPCVMGKIGTDIEDNKCSWLIVQALASADESQRKVLEKSYGRKDDDAAVLRVKQIFSDLHLEQRFKDFEQSTYKKLQELIAQQNVLPDQVFTSFLENIFKRTK